MVVVKHLFVQAIWWSLFQHYVWWDSLQGTLPGNGFATTTPTVADS